jgi:hypothetical protein
MRSALLTRAAVITASIATTAFMVTGTADAAATSPKSPKSHPTSLSILMPKAGAKHAPKAAAKQAPKAAAKQAPKAAAKHAPKGAKHRNKAMVRGLLKSGKEGLAREVVDLDRIAAGNKLTLVGKVVTNKAGVARFLVSRKSVAVKYVLVFKGSRALAPSHSGVVVVKAS